MTTTERLGFSPLEAAALRCLGKDLEERAKSLAAGKQQTVDFMLHIQGQVNKGEDGLTTRTNKPAPEEVLAWMLSQFTDEARSKLLDAWTAQVKANGGGVPQVEGSSATMAKHMIALASKVSTHSRSGSMSAALVVQAVDPAKLKPATIKAIGEISRLITFEESGESNE